MILWTIKEGDQGVLCEYMDKEGDGEIVNKRKEQRNHASPRAKETTSDEWKQKNKKSG